MPQPIGIWEIPRGSKVKVTLVDPDTEESAEAILTYQGMDGMYARLYDSKNNIYPAT